MITPLKLHRLGPADLIPGEMYIMRRDFPISVFHDTTWEVHRDRSAARMRYGSIDTGDFVLVAERMPNEIITPDEHHGRVRLIHKDRVCVFRWIIDHQPARIWESVNAV